MKPNRALKCPRANCPKRQKAALPQGLRGLFGEFRAGAGHRPWSNSGQPRASRAQAVASFIPPQECVKGWFRRLASCLAARVRFARPAGAPARAASRHRTAIRDPGDFTSTYHLPSASGTNAYAGALHRGQACAWALGLARLYRRQDSLCLPVILPAKRPPGAGVRPDRQGRSHQTTPAGPCASTEKPAAQAHVMKGR